MTPLNLRRNLVQPILAARDQNEVCALGCQLGGEFLAETRAGAGDEDGFLGEVQSAHDVIFTRNLVVGWRKKNSSNVLVKVES